MVDNDEIKVTFDRGIVEDVPLGA